MMIVILSDEASFVTGAFWRLGARFAGWA